MKKETLLSYLEKCLNKRLTEYDFAIDWDKRNQTIEVIVRLYAQNNQAALIEDAEGVTSEEDVIEFEDGLLFYNPEKSQFDPEEYLAVLPYEGKRGLPTYYIESVAKYLQIVLEEGLSDLMDFLQDEDAEVFELKWKEDIFQKIVAIPENEGITKNYVGYPSY